MNESRQDSGDQAKRRQHHHRRERIAVDLLRGLRGRAARPSEKRHAVCLDETRRRQRGGQGQQRADRRHHDLQRPLRQLRTEQDRLEHQPFRDKAVERRKRRDRDAADEKDERGQRHAVDEAAELLHVPLARRRQHGAGAEEQQALEERMIENVKQRRGEGQRRGERQAVSLERQRKAEADEDDADIFDRV